MMAQKYAYYGFTLAEMLIALVLVGVIAAMVIPKLLNSFTEKSTIAGFRSNIAALQIAIINGNQSDEMTSSTSLTSYLAGKLNARKTCLNDFNAEGCYDSSIRTPANNLNGGGFVLPNNFTVVDIITQDMSVCNGAPTSSSCNDGWILDINGNNGPNIQGQDILSVVMRWGGVPANDLSGVWRRPGELTLDPAYTACSGSNPQCADAIALWQKIGY